MYREHASVTRDEAAGYASRVLEFFARGARVTFDRPLAARTVAETVRAIPGDDALSWSGRLVESGESLNLRIRATDLSIREVLRLVGQGIPVCVCRDVASESTDSPIAWFALAELRRGRVRVAAIDGGQDEWVRVSHLPSLFGVPNARTPFRCITGQAALPCEVVAMGEDGQPCPVKPYERLIGLLCPEKSDLWTVLVFSIMVGILALASPIAVEALVNTVAFGRYLQPVIVLSFILLTFLGFAAAIRGLNTLIVEVIQRRLFVRVVEDLAYRLPRVQQHVWDKQFGPELVNRFFDVVTVQKAVAKLVLDGIAVLLQTMIGMAVLAFYHPYLLGFDVVLLALIGFVLFALGRGAVRTAIKESKTKYAVAAWLEELVRHPTAFKLHGGTQFALDRADKLAVDYLEARRQHFRIVLRQVLFALGLQAVAATVLLGLGGLLVIQGELTLGQLVAAELIVTMIVGSFAKLGQQMEGFYDLLASVDKLGQLFDLPVERHDKLFHLRETAAASLSLHRVQASVGTRKLFGELSYTVAPGTTLAVMGASGTGKSILLDLISGMRQPSSGHLELDGIDLRNCAQTRCESTWPWRGELKSLRGR